MKKFVCTVCGYVFEGEAAPAECPVCHAGADKFKEQTGDKLKQNMSRRPGRCGKDAVQPSCGSGLAMAE